jgi:L-aspartate oxidase
MWKHAGLIRSEASLLTAHAALARLEPDGASDVRENSETSNLALLAELVIGSALLREESRGAHYRADYPQHDSAWLRHVIVSREGTWLSPTVAPELHIHAAS